MRPIAIICGVIIAASGLIALITGEFGGFGPWLLAVGFACAGLAGLASSVLKDDHPPETA